MRRKKEIKWAIICKRNLNLHLLVVIFKRFIEEFYDWCNFMKWIVARTSSSYGCHVIIAVKIPQNRLKPIPRHDISEFWCKLVGLFVNFISTFILSLQFFLIRISKQFI